MAAMFFGFLLSCCLAAMTEGVHYDSIDIDEILTNERLYLNYFHCLRGVGKCSPEGRDLKNVLPDALASECAKCSEKQKKDTEKVIKFLLKNKPKDYDILEKIYDKEGNYRRKYQGA